jgi:hypothetical protein
MATVAVFLSLAGGAAAVSAIGSKQIANNSVRSGDLRNNSARGKDVRDGALTGNDIGDESIGGNDIGDGSIGAADLAAGVISPSGDARLSVRVGSAGTAGANGSGAGCVDGVPAGSTGYYDNVGVLVPCGGGAGGASSATAQCGFGEVATGGGYSYAAGKRHALVTESRPVPAGPTPTGWQIRIETLTNDSSNSTPVTPYVVCMRP